MKSKSWRTFPTIGLKNIEAFKEEKDFDFISSLYVHYISSDDLKSKKMTDETYKQNCKRLKSLGWSFIKRFWTKTRSGSIEIETWEHEGE